jgi:hypothetical protein
MLHISNDHEAGQIKDVTAAAEAFASGRGPPPTDVHDEKFSVLLDGPVMADVPKHPWNVAAGKLLIQAFRAEYPQHKVNDAFLETRFESRLLRMSGFKAKAVAEAPHQV